MDQLKTRKKGKKSHNQFLQVYSKNEKENKRISEFS